MSRNVVLVTYDSLRYDHCGYAGYERDTTPTLDEMADDGLAYENAVASGVPTIASMTSVMTGRHSLASPEIGFDKQQREQVTSRATIAEVLSDAGYATGALSPNPPASSYFGFDDGFDWFEDFLAEDRGILERAWNRIFERSIGGGGLSTYLRLARNVVQREEVLRPWEDFYDEILAWRERVEEPYFLWVLLLEPHHPWVPPSRHQHWSSRWDKIRSFKHYWEMLSSGWEPGFDETVHERLIDLYDDSIRYGDRFLAQLREDLGDDDPVYLVHADHGEEFGGHGRYGHQAHLTEDLIHVPLVIDGLEESDRVRDPVALRQLAPTIAEVAGADHPFTAESAIPAGDAAPGNGVDGEGAAGRTAPLPDWVESKVFTEDDRRVAIRTTTGKFHDEPEGQSLYDLATDPDEQRDLSDESPEAVAAFGDCVARHVATEGDERAIAAAAAALADGERPREEPSDERDGQGPGERDREASGRTDDGGVSL